MSPSQPTPALGAHCWFPAQKQFSLEQAVVGSEQLPGLWCAVCCVPEPGCPHGAAVLGETCSSGSWCHTPGGWFETLCGWKLCCLILVLLPSHSRLLVNGRCLLSEKLLPGHCCPFPSAELLFRWLLSLGIARCHRRWAGLGARCRHMGNIPVPPGLILGMSITPGG